MRRALFTRPRAVVLSYQVELAAALELIRTAVQQTDGVLAEPAPLVQVRALGASDIIVATGAAARRTIIETLQRVGIDLPDPGARTVLLDQRGEHKTPLRGSNPS